MRDEWSGLADLLANLVAKYADVIDADSVEILKDDVCRFLEAGASIPGVFETNNNVINLR